MYNVYVMYILSRVENWECLQNGHRRWDSGIDEEEHVRNEGRGQQFGNGNGESTSGTRRICFTTKKIEYRV